MSAKKGHLDGKYFYALKNSMLLEIISGNKSETVQGMQKIQLFSNSVSENCPFTSDNPLKNLFNGMVSLVISRH